MVVVGIKGRKNLAIALGVCLSCMITTGASGQDVENIQKKAQEPMACYEPAVLELANGIGCRVLSKPFDRIPGPTIVFAINKEGKTILNPQGPAYPKSKNLKGLSYADAVELFGHPESKQKEVKTFNLMPATGSRDYRAQHMFHLDAKFYRGRLHSCKLRNSETGSRAWTKIQ